MIKNIRQSNEDKSRAGSLIYMECKAGRENDETGCNSYKSV